MPRKRTSVQCSIKPVCTKMPVTQAVRTIIQKYLGGIDLASDPARVPQTTLTSLFPGDQTLSERAGLSPGHMGLCSPFSIGQSDQEKSGGVNLLFSPPSSRRPEDSNNSRTSSGVIGHDRKSRPEVPPARALSCAAATFSMRLDPSQRSRIRGPPCLIAYTNRDGPK